jgi:signal peptide peptidase SppA
LLVHRAKLDVILAVLGDRLNIRPPAADLALPGPRNPPAGTPGIAVIPVHGTLVKRTAGLDAASGLTSYAEIGAMLAAALADPAVAGILLDVDSPGGEASGSFELARQVRAASTVKPVWAVANDSAFSAAYAIAASAQRVIVAETGGVGSIGVIALHIDQSVKDAQDGYRYTAITAGSHKNDFSPHAPLDDAARAELQTEVDRLYGLFAGQVAVHRGMSEERVRATEAGLFFGPNAVTVGLADGVGTFESALADFSLFLTPQGRTRSPARAPSLVGCAPLSHKEPVMQNPELK